MAFPPSFLDELRGRLALSAVVGKHLRLVRAGREYKAPCPFHNEKTPSFTVNDQKGFFHCFGCGAHGDVIGFVMRYHHLSFPEAVEQLAGEAGLAVPQDTPEERHQHDRQKTLYEVVEQATRWFEQQLTLPPGREALDYLQRRGLGDEAIARFRLGYAPADRGTLRPYLLGLGFSDADLLEVGLTKRPDDGRAPYAFFRHRVIFPVADRRGRVVAFGARLLEGDGPKYLNSPDTSLFHKGQLLYGLSRARQAAADGAALIVAEGYMDVITLVEAGFAGAVAPLGTALTESQIEALWAAIPGREKCPVLCFDGDQAGRRAAARAVERVLPLLGPDRSIQVAFLPQGEDPDSLIRAGGAAAMQRVLGEARPLVQVVWELETMGRPAATPETRAGVRAALEARADQIADHAVQQFYRQDFRQRLDQAFGWQRQRGDSATYRRSNEPRGGRAGGGRGGPGGTSGGGRGPGAGSGTGFRPQMRPPRPAAQVQERILLATVINHPELFDELAEPLAQIPLAAPGLERLRRELMGILAAGGPADSALDAEAVQGHLSALGYTRELADLLGSAVYDDAGFARPDAPHELARKGWWEVWHYLRQPGMRSELSQAEGRLRQELDEANLRRLEALRQELARLAPGGASDEDGPGAGGPEGPPAAGGGSGPDKAGLDS